MAMSPSSMVSLVWSWALNEPLAMTSFHRQLYLGVTVDGDAEMSPRMRVGGGSKANGRQLRLTLAMCGGEYSSSVGEHQRYVGGQRQW